MKLLTALALVALTAISSGCATITSGTSQTVRIETVDAKGDSAPGYDCAVTNGKGAYSVKTPGSITISKAYGNAELKCEKPGEPATVASVKSSTKAYTAGNILVGGVIGLGVDAMSGATWAYPDLWKIILGKSPQILSGAGNQLDGEDLRKELETAKTEKK